jgi:hypothetical protein
MLEHIPVRVHGISQIAALNRTPDRLAVEADEHSRRRAEEDRWRLGLHAVDVPRPDLAAVETGKQAVECDDALGLRHGLLELAEDFAQRVAAQRTEVRLGDRERREAHEPFRNGDGRRRGDLDGAEHRLV